MICWLSDNNIENKKIDTENLNKIMKLVTKKNKYGKYLLNLYSEYKEFLYENNNPVLVSQNLNKNYKFFSNHKNLNKCDLILSDNHKQTYFAIKELNINKIKKSAIICFDMHSDTYEYTNKLWKGNVFSKLLYERYIDYVFIIGIPKYKRNTTKKDIPKDIKNQVLFIDIKKIKYYLNKYKIKNLYVSIDIDCLNTRKLKMTALEYCPANILKNLSNFPYNKINKFNIENYLEKAIFVKNEWGYSNLFHTGENNLNLNDLKTAIKNIKKIVKELKIKLGFDNGKCFADITEINGYDYAGITSNIVSELIEELLKGGEEKCKTKRNNF